MKILKTASPGSDVTGSYKKKCKQFKKIKITRA